MVLRYSSVREIQRRRLERHRASNFLQHADADARAGDRVLLVARESPTKNKKEDLRRLKNQVRDLRRAAAERQLLVVGVIARICSGKDPRWLIEVGAAAKKFGPDVKALFQRSNRIARPDAFHPQNNSGALPTEQEWQDVLLCLDGVVPMTLLHPDATNREDASYRSTYGQDVTGNKGGGSRKSRIADALGEHSASGRIRPVAKRYGIPKSTLYNLIQAVKAAGK